MPRPYPPEFRRRALDLVESGRTVREVAASLGIAESCLYRWRHRDLVDRGLKPGDQRRRVAELAAARDRIRDLEEEIKILRKAAAAVEAVVPPKDRYRLVAELHADGVRTGQACHALGVSRSGYYAWAAPGAVAAVDPPCLADRPDRHHPPGLPRHLRRAPGARRAGRTATASRSGTTPSAC